MFKNRPSRKRLKRPEQACQIGIFNWANPFMAMDNCRQFLAFHVPNGMTTSPAQAGIFKALGLRAGVADIVVLLRGGKTLLIEMKVQKLTKVKKELSKADDRNENQKIFAAQVEALGFEYIVLSAQSPRDALNQFIKILEDNGVNTKCVFKKPT